MKKQLLLLLLGIPFVLTAQFKIETEYNYLKLINTQHNKTLIKSNVINAEIAANHFYMNDNSQLTALFYNELANSFSLTGAPEKALFYQMVQRVLFANDSVNNASKAIFKSNTFLSGLKKSASVALANRLTHKLPKTKDKQMLLVLKLAIKLNMNEQIPEIKTLANRLKLNEYKMPSWYKDWEFLTLINIKEKHMLELLSFNNENGALLARLSGKNKIRVYNKTIKHYIKKNGLVRAKELLNEYKSLKLTFLKRLGVSSKKTRICIKSIFN